MMFIEKAFAKVNLHLQVLNRRPDGYHEIASLMAELSIHDLLQLVQSEQSASPRVELINGGGAFAALLDEIPPEQNLACRAAMEYLTRARLSESVTLKLEKNIPAGGGLGGGSSDAAAVLRLMNRRYGLLDETGLLECAARVGSDVPFCVAGTIAVVRGRGELLRKITGKLSGTVLVVFPGIHVATATAYRDLQRGNEACEDSAVTLERLARIESAVTEGDMQSLSSLCINDFERVVFSRHPELGKGVEVMADNGAVFARMSGSGSTLFGVFPDEVSARRAAEILGGMFPSVLITRFVQREDT